MAEYIGGSEETFVAMMNDRAKGLGMETAKFEDCCGLTASTTHAMSARDIALMSRELITKYPEIFRVRAPLVPQAQGADDSPARQ